MKGIILAGGTGSRLFPMTAVVNKQLLPVYDKPMIYYPLATLMEAGIREILIIAGPTDREGYRKLLGDGSFLGLRIEYAVQERPNGLPQAFVIGQEFIGLDVVTLILGDNLFFGPGIAELIVKAGRRAHGATVFAYPVADPHRYGVVELDTEGRPLSIEEKPLAPRSNLALTGLYVCDARAPQIAAHLQPSKRGETEITDVHKAYLAEGSLYVEVLPRGTAWLGTGMPEALLEAANFIHVLEKRQGIKVACVEEVAYRKGFIGLADLAQRAEELGKCAYAQYLMTFVHAEALKTAA